MSPCGGSPFTSNCTGAVADDSVSKHPNDDDLLKKYILQCPYVDNDSPAVIAALSGLANAQANINVSQTTNVLTSTPTRISKKKKTHPGVWTFLRVILLDSPLLVVFGLCMFLSWVHYVHDNYLVKQLEAAEWTDERASQTDLTYYTRPCFSSDMSTFNARDLFLSEDATAQEAYEHQLHHGFTVFPKVLSADTVRSLRQHFDERNRNLTEAESNFVLSGNNRYSFNPGVEDPVVANAMEELTNNRKLKDSVEKIMGKNPALIEMTAITSSYGAVAQEWHDDVVPEASPVQYARSFGPSYSIFVVLQNTTKSMGATDACPGLHMCAAGPMESVCQENGFQVVGEKGYWRAGDALLMNMNSWHRGAAHTDPDAPDRVMLILTWVPRPRSHAESRQLAQGITFSLRWDQWGHTWNDLRQAATTMKQPWAMLRALGLYKKPSADWGIDYVSSATMRMANEDNGFKPDELMEFFHRDGGFKFLPSWLHGYVDDDEETSWHEFLLETLALCERFATMVCKCMIGGYIALYFLTSLVLIGLHGSVQEGARRLGRAIFRLGAMAGIVYALYKLGIRHVDESQWASDIRHGLRYTSPFGNEESRFDGPTAFPHRNDVLIESRFKSDYLALYNDYVSNHPGNRVWKDLVDDKVDIFASYNGLPSQLQDAVAEYIVGDVTDNAGRFLYQNPDSDFVKITQTEAVAETKRELVRKSNPVRSNVLTQLDYLISEAKYGHLRKSVMSKDYSFPYLVELQSQLLSISTPSKPFNCTSFTRPQLPKETLSTCSFQQVQRTVLSINLKRNSSQLRREVTLAVGSHVPSHYSHLQSGTIAEVSIGRGGNKYWYKARVNHVASTGDVSVIRLDHSGQEIDTHRLKIRPYVAPEVGETVEVRDGVKYFKGTVVLDKGNGLFDVDVDGEVWEDEPDTHFRRAQD